MILVYCGLFKKLLCERWVFELSLKLLFTLKMVFSLCELFNVKVWMTYVRSCRFLMRRFYPSKISRGMFFGEELDDGLISEEKG